MEMLRKCAVDLPPKEALFLHRSLCDIYVVVVECGQNFQDLTSLGLCS